MFEMIMVPVRCSTCGTTTEALPDAQEITCMHCGTPQRVPAYTIPASMTPAQQRREQQERAEAILNMRKTLGDLSHSTPTEETGRAHLDAILPPGQFEKLLPFAALLAVIAGCIAFSVSQHLAYTLMAVDPLLVGVYLYIKSDRQQRARELSQSHVRMWFKNLYALQRGL
jgi:hypothetical protein